MPWRWLRIQRFYFWTNLLHIWISAIRFEILELVKRLNREFGITIVMVLHDINQAIYFSDEIIGLKDGVVTVHGKPDEAVNRESIARLYGIDLEVREIDGKKFVLTV